MVVVAVVERRGWGLSTRGGARIYVHACRQSHILICPARLLDNFDLRHGRENGFRLKSRLADRRSLSPSELPDSSSEERVKRVQPVVHLFVVSGLKQYPAMLCTHGERVWGLLSENKAYYSAKESGEKGTQGRLASHRPSAWPAGPRCTPPERRTG